ncbi:hypothetical protein GCM10022267_75810 [Lentzea roselyniae]|uniref:histidine kinase n=1 Tax=Lentzea roselyniae TaxID=531940 RepID=A0ABP7C2M1_9PSEU
MDARERDRRAIDAVREFVSGSLGRTSVHPQALAEAIGRGAGAVACVLTVLGERFHWSVGDGTWWEGTVKFDGAAQGSVALSPAGAGQLDGLLPVLGPLLMEIRLRLEADQVRRRGDAAHQELADGRWRAAAQMDRERRDVERDLHDGAQHHLVALQLAVGLLSHAVSAGDRGTANRMLDGLEGRFDDAERQITRTAAGILPIALVTGGLVAALDAELRHHDDVVLQLDPTLRRIGAAAETAVYFVCMESVNNAHKHAPGASITVSVRDTGDTLSFEVRDNGRGFADVPPDAGLHHLVSRMVAVGGDVSIHSTPGAGTVVAGFVPHDLARCP